MTPTDAQPQAQTRPERDEHAANEVEDTRSDLSGLTTIVVGASRGLGRGIATAVGEAGAPVIAVARTATAQFELAGGAGTIEAEIADAGDATVAGTLLDRYDPHAVILVAGAAPLMRPLPHHTWETFSVNWHTDVRMAFHWLREILLKPLRPGSRVVVVSSGAARAGSPLSGGYAGAKATQRFITAYAQDEARRAGLGITFTAVLPALTPLTDLGRPAVRAYAARSGQSEEEYLQKGGEPLTPEVAGTALVELLRADAATVAPRVPAHRRRDAEGPPPMNLRPPARPSVSDQRAATRQTWIPLVPRRSRKHPGVFEQLERFRVEGMRSSTAPG
jgi:NAD(P)-dependent dehydrogenase (short-subunit alcohol dehydrogenase family)